MRLPKLSKQQIKESLEMTPAHVILAGNRKLTHKQRQFARGIVEGLNQTEAYAQAYKHKGKRKTMSDNASRLIKDSRVQAEVEALERAKLYLDYQSSAQKIAELRSLVVSQLTKEALDPSSPPNARIQALSKLGSVSELQVFTEHKVEKTVIRDSESARKELMEQLKQALGDNMRTIEQDDDELELLEVISAPAKRDGTAATPPSPDPHLAEASGSLLLHSNPDTQSQSETKGVGGTKNSICVPYTDAQEDTPSDVEIKG
jgi:phage terminase small subunit